MAQILPFIQGAGALYGATQAFRGGGQPQQTTQVGVDPATQARYQDIYQRALGLSQQPFIPYTGPQIAGFSPDQLRAFGAQRQQFARAQAFDPFAQRQQLMQAQAPQIERVQPFMGAQISAPRQLQVPSLLSADISAYRSPFEQGVVDVALGDIQRQSDIAQQRAQEQAIRAGAFGGSRGAILEAEATRPFAEQAARTAAQLRQTGFEQAQRAAESDIQRQLAAQQFGIGLESDIARQQAQLQQQAGLAGLDIGARRALEQARLGQAQQQFQANLIGQQEQAQRAAVSGLLGTGAQQQALQQQALGAARGEFERALQYPYQQFGLLSQAVSGIPGTKTYTESSRLGPIDRLSQGLGALERLGSFFPPSSGTTPSTTPSTTPYTGTGFGPGFGSGFGGAF